MAKHESVPRWKKSSHSGNQGGECVETAVLDQAVAVRDSTDVRRGHLAIPAGSWGALTAAIRH